jgi:hypothetical protein
MNKLEDTIKELKVRLDERLMKPTNTEKARKAVSDSVFALFDPYLSFSSKNDEKIKQASVIAKQFYDIFREENKTSDENVATKSIPISINHKMSNHHNDDYEKIKTLYIEYVNGLDIGGVFRSKDVNTYIKSKMDTDKFVGRQLDRKICKTGSVLHNEKIVQKQTGPEGKRAQAYIRIK